MNKFEMSFCAKVYINTSIILRVKEKDFQLTLFCRGDSRAYSYSF